MSPGAGAGSRDSGQPADGPEDDVEMDFFGHLAELRVRLRRGLLGCLPASGVCWAFKE